MKLYKVEYHTGQINIEAYTTLAKAMYVLAEHTGINSSRLHDHTCPDTMIKINDGWLLTCNCGVIGYDGFSSYLVAIDVPDNTTSLMIGNHHVDEFGLH